MKGRAYYNEYDPFAARWLANLAANDKIVRGIVDDRDMRQINPNEVKEYTQCHFFAGIGGWSYALRLAGWPDDRPVWTASCPCQPLSGAGQRKGHADERHLWPALFDIIAECRPATILGEQVASRDGREWFSGVRADLESLGYACGAADLSAAGVGAPHTRQRLYWVADANSVRQQEPVTNRSIQMHDGNGEEGAGMAHDLRVGSYAAVPAPGTFKRGDGNANPTNEGMGHFARQGWQGQRGQHSEGGGGAGGQPRSTMQDGVPEWNGPTIVIPCTDGPRRIPAEPSLFPVADGVPGRVGFLRGAGNAIVPQVAAAFIRSVMEVI